VNVPVPVPLFVFVPEIVGLAVVLMHTPRAVTDANPSAVTLPPVVAPFCEIEEAAVVVTVGITGLKVVKLISLP
jgi:hypothetical protein